MILGRLGGRPGGFRSLPGDPWGPSRISLGDHCEPWGLPRGSLGDPWGPLGTLRDYDAGAQGPPKRYCKQYLKQITVYW